MKLIVAVDEKWGIGKNGDLLLSIPDDMMYYRTTTRGKVVVMGYTTLLSLPGSKPAPGRLNLVLADIKGLRVPGAVVCGSMEQLHRLIGCFEPDDVFDIGGGSMYRQLLPYCCAAHITKMRFDGEADTAIPNLDELHEWSVDSESEVKEHDGVRYSFVVYRNASPALLPDYPHKSSAMASYFRKKEPLETALPEDADDEYRKELKALLTAYFYPLKDGFSAADVERFFESGGGVSFEQYLRDKHLIADIGDIEALKEKYGLADKKAVSVTVDKNNLSVIDEHTD
ncbi:MAG: dihydrofolate reductase [Ruminococcus sp.]|uniref:dihydrofolate reductase n=1 Tax=Ruminococcus sp. TaxID=41978 RepID=UPI002872DDE4|nr:dihydrofolate reductase [Ruminococcus sp.]MBQ3284430.1 dihydrofolate reductase [Ruminococcus sp.]